MKTLFSIMLFFISSISLSANNIVKIDSTYNIGVECYTNSDYKRALNSFLICDSLVNVTKYATAERDSAYLSQWIASCYFKLHHYKRAIDYNIDSFGYEPIDKRLTIKSDSIAKLASNAMNNSEFDKAINLLNKVAQLEVNNVGENWYYINTLCNTYICYSNLGSHDESERLFNEIVTLHNKRYGEVSPLMYWVYSNEGYRRLNTTQITNTDDVIFILRPFMEAVKQYNLINDVGFSGNYHILSSQLNKDDLKKLNACISFLLMKLSDLDVNSINKKFLKSLALSFYQDADFLFIDSLKNLIYSVKYDFEQLLAASLLKIGISEDILFDHTWITVKHRLSNNIDTFSPDDFAVFLNDYRFLVYDFILTGNCYYRSGLLVNFVEYIDGFDNAYTVISQLMQSNKLAYADYLLTGFTCSTKNLDNTLWVTLESKIRNLDGQNNFNILSERRTSEDFDYNWNLSFVNLQNKIMDFYQDDLIESEETVLEQKCLESNIYSPLGFLYYKKTLKCLVSGNMEDALVYAEKVLNSFKHDYPKDNLLTYAAYKLLAISHMYNNNKEVASECFKKAVTILWKYQDFHSEFLSPQPLYFAHSFIYFKGSVSHNGSSNERVRNEFLDFDNPLSDKFLEPSYCKDHEFNELIKAESLSLTDFLIPSQKNLGEWNKAYNNSLIAYVIFSSDSDWIHNSVFQYALSDKIRPEWIDDLCWYSHLANNVDDVTKFLSEGNLFFRAFLKSTFRRSDASARAKAYDIFYQKRAFSELIEDFKYSYAGNPLSASHFFRATLPYLAVTYPNSYNLETLYDGLLIDKGILLSTERELNKIILNCGNDTIISMYNNYTKLQTKLENAISKEEIEDLKNSIKYLENSLVEKSKEFGDFTKFMDFTWRDIYNALDDKQIAVEFFEVQENNKPNLYAIILYKGCNTPQLISFPEYTPCKTLDLEFLYNSIWKPLLSHIPSRIETIFFSPSGSLHTMPIEYSLHNTDFTNNNLIRCYRLSSTRELILEHNDFSYEDLILYGGLRYDTPNSVLIEDSKRYQTRDLGLNTDSIASCLNLRSGVCYLPGSKEEVLKIVSMLNPAQKDRCSIYTDSLGTETSFKNITGKRLNILHIATHGFYFTSDEVSKIGSTIINLQKNSDSTSSNEDLALTRSGLLFSGANNALMGNKADGVDDGVLTAKELSSLDFSNVDFVILSACQTGLGEITQDGVYGLQRGFKKAGVNTLLMSLWKVDDTATQLLMTKFHEYLLLGKNKLDALTLAQDFLREYTIEIEDTTEDSSMTLSQRRRNHRLNDEMSTISTTLIKVKPYEDPKYWASFILLDALN